MISVNRLKAMENSGNERMRDDRGLGVFNVTEKSPQSIGLSLTWVGGKGVRRDRHLHLLGSALEHCEPLAGALRQWHSLGRSLV